MIIGTCRVCRSLRLWCWYWLGKDHIQILQNADAGLEEFTAFITVLILVLWSGYCLLPQVDTFYDDLFIGYYDLVRGLGSDYGLGSRLGRETRRY